MGAKWQRIAIAIPTKYKPAARLAIAQDMIDRIVERTRKENVDKNGRSFPAYSDAYVKSKAFRAAGKSRSDVNITLSKETLDSLQLLSHRSGEVRIGFENGTDANAKADGNIRGTYGRPQPIPGKARDFLGLTKAEIKEILNDYEDENA